MISPWYYAALGICIALSAFCSASEMAFSSANRMRLESMRDEDSRKAGAAVYILDKFDDALSAILIGNNLVNIGASSIGSVIAILLLGEEYTGYAAAIVTVLVIVFGETMPKIVAKKNATRLAVSFAYTIRGLMFIFKPLVALVVWLVHLITDPMKGDEAEDAQEAAVEELQSIIETVEGEGVIDEDRSELLRSALDFSDISVSEIMTARVDMDALDIEDDWEDILDTINGTTHSRIPVYEDSIDNVIGVLYLNHFFKAMVDSDRPDIRALLMEPCFVYKTTKLPSVLNELRLRKTHLAIVTDEYGGSMGVVTMEDVLEQIVGEIWDETDEFEPDIIDRGSGRFELVGDLSISDFLELLSWDEDSFDTDSATVGGWTLEMFGSFPKEGESFKYENLTVTVLKTEGLRVEKVIVEVGEPDEE